MPLHSVVTRMMMVLSFLLLLVAAVLRMAAAPSPSHAAVEASDEPYVADEQRRQLPTKMMNMKKQMTKGKGGKGAQQKASTTKKYFLDPATFYVGLWIGVDPQDGAEMFRVFTPVVDDEYRFEFAGKAEFSTICGGGAQADEGFAEGVAQTRVAGRFNGAGYVDADTHVLKVQGNLTCFGEADARVTGVPVDFVPVGHDMIAEVVAFRADQPIYLHRAAPYFVPIQYEYVYVSEHH